MKKITYLIPIFFIISCNNDYQEEKQPFSSIDSTYSLRVLNEINSARAELSSTTIIDPLVKAQLHNTLLQLDTLQIQVKDLQLDKIRLIIVENKLKKLKMENTDLFIKVDRLKKENDNLKDSFESRKIEVTTLSLTNKKLKAAIKLGIAGVNTKAYTTSKSFLRKSKVVETTLAKDVEKVEVNFIVTSNANIPKDQYVFSISLFGVGGSKGITKDLTVYYDGTEIPCIMVFNDVTSFKIGWHRVVIVLNKEILYDGSMNLY